MTIKTGQFIFLRDHYLCKVTSSDNRKRVYGVWVVNGRWDGVLHMNSNSIEIPPQGHWSANSESIWHQLPESAEWMVVKPHEWSKEMQEYWYYLQGRILSMTPLDVSPWLLLSLAGITIIVVFISARILEADTMQTLAGDDKDIEQMTDKELDEWLDNR